MQPHSWSAIAGNMSPADACNLNEAVVTYLCCCQGRLIAGLALPQPATLRAPCWPALMAALVRRCCPEIRWVMEGATPVHWLVAPRQQVLRPDVWLIALIVPLLMHQVRVQGLQGVAPAGCLASTDGAARLPPDPAVNRGLPGMVMATQPGRAQPPHSLVRAASDALWCGSLVPGGVPLGCQVWALLGQGWLPCSSQLLQECTDTSCHLQICQAAKTYFCRVSWPHVRNWGSQ